MNTYVTASTIKTLREKQKITQAQLGEILSVSDKTVSKWETGRGLPDITLIEPLAKALSVSVTELLSGNLISNSNICANMKKASFYVCPVCGNVISSAGDALIHCCGIALPPLLAENDDENLLSLEKFEDEYFITVNHKMTKEHYISFIAYATDDRIQLAKLYPEGNAETRFKIKGHGYVYFFCNRHGLFKKTI